MRETFGAAVRRLRAEQTGTTLRNLARSTHIDPGHLSRIERDLRPPTPDIAAVLDEALSGNGYLVSLAADAGDLAARESAKLTDMLCGISPSDMVGEMAAETHRLAVAYLSSRPGDMLVQAGTLRRRAISALHGGRLNRPTELADAVLYAGYLSGVISYAALDLNDSRSAMTHAEAAWHAAESAGSDPLRAWVRGTQSLIARFSGEFPRALSYAEDGLRYATSGTARVRLLGGMAQCHANMSNGPAARAALGAAVDARDCAHESDDLPGLFAFSQAKQHYYSGSVLVWLDTETMPDTLGRVPSKRSPCGRWPSRLIGPWATRRWLTSTRLPHHCSSMTWNRQSNR